MSTQPTQGGVTAPADLLERLERAEARNRELEAQLASGLKFRLTDNGAVSVSGGAVGYPVAHTARKWVVIAKAMPQILKWISENAEQINAKAGAAAKLDK